MAALYVRSRSDHFRLRARSTVLSASLIVSVFAPHAAEAEDALPEIVITGRQLPPLFTERLFSSTTIDRTLLDNAPQSRLDDVLRTAPGFNLFRRQSSRASHPTTQGVTLRGLGPSGAGRTLVLLDGVPQNDPFGGWVDWSRLPALGLDHVSITRGGGAGQWGNFALAGTVQLRTSAERNTAELQGDSTGGGQGIAHVTFRNGPWHASATVSGHATGGNHLLPEDQRGPVDVPATSRGGLIAGTGSFALDESTKVAIGASYSEDRFINGIEAARSVGKIGDGNLSIVRDGGVSTVSWELHAYYREQNFSSIFVAVNPARTTATPSLDQFRVPATALGGSGILRFPVTDAITLQIGADARNTSGETHERLTPVNGVFTRQRVAGGEQVTAGTFAEVGWEITPTLTAIVALRGDYWRQSRGKRLETSIDGATVFVDNTFVERDGLIANGRVGARWQADDDLALRAVTYSGYRAPTLNELYRPFRVGNDITEANPALNLERLYGGEVGFDYDFSARARLSATYFHTKLKNGIGNVTLQTTPGLNPIFNVFVPAGGVLRQRQNIRGIESRGVEVDMGASLLETLSLDIRYLYTHPRVTQSDAEPGLIGKRLAQVSKHAGSVALTWTDEAWTIRAEARGASGSFEDDQNARNLGGYVVADVFASWHISRGCEIFLSGENVFDKAITAGKGADGRITLGTPRIIGGGVRVVF